MHPSLCEMQLQTSLYLDVAVSMAAADSASVRHIGSSLHRRELADTLF